MLSTETSAPTSPTIVACQSPKPFGSRDNHRSIGGNLRRMHAPTKGAIGVHVDSRRPSRATNRARRTPYARQLAPARLRRITSDVRSESPKKKSSESRTANPWLRAAATRRHRVRQCRRRRAAADRHRVRGGELQPADDRCADGLPPKIPLRVWTADGMLIGEFGEERRDFVRIAEVPRRGSSRRCWRPKTTASTSTRRRLRRTGCAQRSPIVRAARPGRQHDHDAGRTELLSVVRAQLHPQDLRDRAVVQDRRSLSKDRILEIYMNQIFLGHRAYGFAAAAQVYSARN